MKYENKESQDTFGTVQNPDRLTYYDNLPCEIGEGGMMHSYGRNTQKLDTV